jgi:hypothetical protein
LVALKRPRLGGKEPTRLSHQPGARDDAVQDRRKFKLNRDYNSGMKFAWSWNRPTLKIAYAEVEALKMDYQSELKQIQDKVDELIDGNFILKANAIKADIQLLRTKLARESSHEARHILEGVDGIDEKLDDLIRRLTDKRT